MEEYTSTLLLPSLVLRQLDHGTKLLLHALPVQSPRPTAVGRLVGECLAQHQRDPHHVAALLMHALNLLLDCILLGLGVEHGLEGVDEDVEPRRGVGGREVDEAHEHQGAEGSDVVVVRQAADDAVVEGGDVEEGEGGFQKGVEGFVGGLLLS